MKLCTGYTYVSQNIYQWVAAVSTEKVHQGKEKEGNFQISEQSLACKELTNNRNA
jgi:hypothetical protein